MTEPDAPAIVVGAGLAGLVAAYELRARDAGSSSWTRRTATIWAVRRSGGWAGCSWWTAGTAPPRHQGLVRAGPAGLDGLRGLRPRGRGPLAAPVGPRLRRVRGHREARLPARARPSASRPWSAGPSAAAAPPTATATPCRASISPGAPAPRWSRVFREPVRRAERRGLVQLRLPAPGRRADRDEDGAVVGVAGAVLEETDAERGVATSRDGWASSSSARPRSSSPPAASATTTS